MTGTSSVGRDHRTPAPSVRFQGESATKWAIRKLFRHEQWNIGLVREPIHRFLDPGYRPRVHWLPSPPPGVFIADPFGVSRGDTVTIMYEELDYRDGKGRITASEVLGDGSARPVGTVMDLPFHLSYPYLLEHHGSVYCVPETNEAGEVAIYVAEDFPRRWRRLSALVPGLRAVDSTLFTHEGRWWLACTDQASGPNSALLLWHAPDLMGPWSPHARNPVKVDPSCARPGGSPFVHEGRLYRPAQDCSSTYGGRVSINEVLTLTPTDFREEQAAVVGPLKHSPYPDGLHTISAVGENTVLDAKKTRFIRQAFGSVVADALRRYTRRQGAHGRR